MRRLRLALAVSLILAGCGRPFGCASHQEQIGSQAPDFALPSLSSDEGLTRLSYLNQDNPVLLVFWATWCPSCVEEIPRLNDWVQEYASSNLQILGINVQEPRSQLKDFIAKHPMGYPVLLDEDASTANAYGVAGVPTIILLAKGGKILYYGFSLPGSIEPLLKKQEI